LFPTWLLYVNAMPMPRPTFFSDPLHAVLLIGASVAAILGGILGELAFVARHERSCAIFLSVILGVLVVFWTIAERIGH
jgi:hypothetical protein